METTIEMAVITCADCGIIFAITKDRQGRLSECHNSFYCPSGHGQNYPESTEADILKKRIKELEATICKMQQQRNQLRKNNIKTKDG